MAVLVKDMPMGNLLVVDALNLCFRYKVQSKKKEFADDFVATIQSLARSYNAGQIIVVADQQGSTYRKEIYPEYKANRKALAEAQTPAEKKESQEFFNEYERALEYASARHLVLRYAGVEADDLAAYLVSRRRDYGFDQIWLISSDADWDLLIKEDVHRFSTVTRKEITLDTWPYDVDPDEYISYKCLIGDKGDNIPGVPGVGPVKAASLIKTYGSAMDICDMAPIESKYKYIQAVNANVDQIRMNYELMDLESYCQEAIGHDNLLDIGRKLMLNEKRSTDLDFG